MKVVHLLDLGEVGGLIRVVDILARAQHDRSNGNHVEVAVVVAPRFESHPFVEEMQSAAIPCHVLRIPPRRYDVERRRVIRLFEERGPTVVHMHGYRSIVVDSGPARRWGAATVATVHGFTGGGWKNRAYEWLQRRKLRSMDAVVAVSEVLRQELERDGVPGSLLTSIPNAWRPSGPLLDRAEARRELGIGDSRFTVGWVGRVSREKGADVLVEAVRHLDPGVLRVEVVGDGPERPALERVCEREELPVRFHGIRDFADRVYRAFDVFVLSSRTEGTPMVLFEAMAAGTPIIAARVGGVPAVVSDDHALLVTPEDPQALARALRAVHDDPTGASRRARAARERLRAYEPGEWAAAYRRVYQSALRRRGEFL